MGSESTGLISLCQCTLLAKIWKTLHEIKPLIKKKLSGDETNDGFVFGRTGNHEWNCWDFFSCTWSLVQILWFKCSAES